MAEARQDEEPEHEPDGEHDDAQQLAHGEEAEEIANLYVGLPEAFTEDAEDGVTHEEDREDVPIVSFSRPVEPQDGEKHETLEQTLVELGRMPGERASLGEDHGPGHMCRFPVEARR